MLRGIMHLLLTQKILKQWLLLSVADSVSQSTFSGVVQQPWKFKYASVCHSWLSEQS